MKFILLFFFLPICVVGQNTIGLPDVINHTKQSYGGGLQTWDFCQDSLGLIYCANNEGLLSFDGKNWKVYPLPNKTIVRSVKVRNDQRIFVGGQDELGYYSSTTNGQLQYHSLTASIPVKDRSFGDVWHIVVLNENVFFRTTHKIFKFSNESVATYNAASEFSFMGLCNGRLYAHDSRNGLLVFENDLWSQLPNSELAANEIVTGILPINKDSALITTLKNGFYTITPAGITRKSLINTSLFKNERVYSSTTVNERWIALATSNNGLYITDHSGNIIQKFGRTEGLQNNNVLSVFNDNQGNLWLGLDNGIDFIANNSAIKNITAFPQAGSGYTTIVYNNRLFAGTSNGLYSVELQPMQDLSFSKGSFDLVKNTSGQNWGLANINNQLLLGHHEGAFLIKDNEARPISTVPGFWNFVPLSNTAPIAKIVAGNYKGLVNFDYANGQFTQASTIPGFDESSRFVAIDKEGNYWVSHPYHGVYMITADGGGKQLISLYDDKKGLPSTLNNHVYKIKNEIVVASQKGVYAYNKQKNAFEPSPIFKELLGDQSIRYLKEDAKGNIWFIHEKNLGVIDFTGKTPITLYLPELNNKMLSGFDFIYPLNEANVFVAAENGFFHINYEKYKRTIPQLKVQVRSVSIISTHDSVLFGGYPLVDNQSNTGETLRPNIADEYKTVHIEYSSSLFGYQENLEYSYRLVGLTNLWSEWTKRTEKEYTTLPPGNYVFEVKVRSNLGNESVPATYAFRILPPWYRTIWAFLLYTIVLLTCVYGFYKWQKQKFTRQQAKYEEEQKRIVYIHELELSKTESELIALRNEKLEAEINYKNSELASSAMHLVKKGELISKSKSQLSQVLKGLDNPEAVADLKKMIRSLTDDDNMDKEWENFARHFDKVHSDFLNEVKDKHPTITPNELKLCAYLRMNLSTKEIAQLMNISVRGVEISRYRLRKKLGIASETSLFDYLINITTENKSDIKV